MSGAHGHSHGHGSRGGHGHGTHAHGATQNIRLAFFLNFSFSIIELIGGFWIGSLAIMADAIHDFGDSISLGGAWFLERYANKRGDQRFNFGYRRFSLLSALISGVVISCGSFFVLFAAFSRFQQPSLPRTTPMIGLAIVGLAINGLAAWRLSTGRTQNEKMLTWHLIEDVLGWAVVLVGAIVIALTNVSWLDPLLAIALSLYVIFNVLRHLKTTLYLFLQGRPENFDVERFLADSLAVPGIERIDHLAVWSLDGETSILSARLHLHSVHDPSRIEAAKARVRAIAKSQGAEATLETCLAAHAPPTQS